MSPNASPTDVEKTRTETPREARRDVLCGIFVGGAGKRMGGVAKGLLQWQDVPLVERLTQTVLRVYPHADVVLVGNSAAYQHLKLRAVADNPPHTGPLGGLHGLLGAAPHATTAVLALACDMPFISDALLQRLLWELPEAAALAAKREQRWEPLCARYCPQRCLPIVQTQLRSGDYSLQRVLDALPAQQLQLSTQEQAELHDWDSPADLPQP